MHAMLRRALLMLALGAWLAMPSVSQAQETKPRAKPRVTKPATATSAPAAPQPAPAVPTPGAAETPLASQPARSEPPLSPPVFEFVDPRKAYFLGPGDVVRVGVFQQPDMAVEGRVSEIGTITVPLVGPVEVGGLTASQVEMRIAYLLKRGGFVRDPQVNVNVLQFKSRPIAVLGNVNRPGRYFLEEGVYRITDALSLAGGAVAGAADAVTLLRNRGGKTEKYDIDIPTLFRTGQASMDLEVLPGDTLYVDRAPTFYIYGEVQRPGAFRLENGMTLAQALSVGGGLTLRGSKKDIQVTRKDAQGKTTSFVVQLGDPIQPDDVIFVKESLF
jgi:polysaccharide export outer membrane protein